MWSTTDRNTCSPSTGLATLGTPLVVCAPTRLSRKPRAGRERPPAPRTLPLDGGQRLSQLPVHLQRRLGCARDVVHSLPAQRPPSGFPSALQTSGAMCPATGRNPATIRSSCAHLGDTLARSGLLTGPEAGNGPEKDQYRSGSWPPPAHRHWMPPKSSAEASDAASMAGNWPFAGHKPPTSSPQMGQQWPR